MLPQFILQAGFLYTTKFGLTAASTAEGFGQFWGVGISLVSIELTPNLDEMNQDLLAFLFTP